VLLLEREAGAHHKLCGEFLSAEGAAALRHLGLPPESLGAQPIRRLRLAAGATVAEAALPFTAWGLSRRRLDAALLARAAALGAEVRQGVAVRALDPTARAHLADGARIAGGGHAAGHRQARAARLEAPGRRADGRLQAGTCASTPRRRRGSPAMSSCTC
jgi:flavin-dependent dehydrogenase